MLEILGLDGKVITGFNGKKDLTLAIARGEIDFMVTSDSTAMRDERDNYVVNLMIVGEKRSAVVPQVPVLSELGVKVPKEMGPVYRFVTSGGMAAVLPPGVPRERIEYLRKAFQSLSNNKELQKAMEKLTGTTTPFVPGHELQQEMVEIKADKELTAKLNAIFKKYTAVH
jgi:tripartite-type tricarboxylate transporter receptor subunit TctC